MSRNIFDELNMIVASSAPTQESMAISSAVNDDMNDRFDDNNDELQRLRKKTRS